MLSAAKYWPMTLVSGGRPISRVGMFAEVLRGGASNYSGVVDNGNFQRLRWLFFGYFRDKATVIIWLYTVRHRLFSDLKMCELE